LQQELRLTAVPGLRERKKQRTHDAIVRAAVDLFQKHGYHATTVADIAEAADIAPRTFFGYFDTKEAVVFHDFDEVRDGFAERLRDRSADETAFDALHAWVEDWLENRDALSAHERARRELIHTTPCLQAREQSNRAVFEQLLSESVAADLDLPADSLRPRLVSAAALAALTALGEIESDADTDTDRAMALVDEALAFANGGLEELRRRPPIA
jgi:AcrR family transcriptional regulator